MSAHTTHANSVLAATFADLCNRDGGLPRRGVPRGKGRHVESPRTWDGVGRRPPGWQDVIRPRKHRTTEEHLVTVPDDIAAKLTDGRGLSVAERARWAGLAKPRRLPDGYRGVERE